MGTLTIRLDAELEAMLKRASVRAKRNQRYWDQTRIALTQGRQARSRPPFSGSVPVCRAGHRLVHGELICCSIREQQRVAGFGKDSSNRVRGQWR